MRSDLISAEILALTIFEYYDFTYISEFISTNTPDESFGSYSAKLLLNNGETTDEFEIESISNLFAKFLTTKTLKLLFSKQTSTTESPEISTDIIKPFINESNTVVFYPLKLYAKLRTPCNEPVYHDDTGDAIRFNGLVQLNQFDTAIIYNGKPIKLTYNLTKYDDIVTLKFKIDIPKEAKIHLITGLKA